MAEAEKQKTAQQKTVGGAPDKKKMPKGGRKGGTIFPRIGLKQALEYSKKLVSKTAIAAQPEATILAGVFNNAGPTGRVRASALKQFGLMEGTAAAYKATQLARDIDGAADDPGRLPLVRRAMLSSKVFRELFETYHGDQATKGKIRGRTQQLGVHPDLGDECADLFMASAETAGLATREADGIRLVAATDASVPPSSGGEAPAPAEAEAQPEHDAASEAKDETRHPEATAAAASPTPGATGAPAPRPRTAADVSVNLTVDSSLDGEKLAKQLALLRSYGLI